MTPLVIDIETAPNTGMEVYLPEPEAPANYKDPEKITAYIAAKKQTQVESMALDVDLCRVIALGYGDLEDHPCVEVANGDDASERSLLVSFWALVEDPRTAIMGYNILGFDLPIIARRSMMLGITPTRLFDTRKYGNHDVIDLMTLLYPTGSARGLKTICKMLGITNPLDGTDGSQVAHMDLKELAAYCANDVSLTQALATRMKGLYWL